MHLVSQAHDAHAALDRRSIQMYPTAREATDCKVGVPFASFLMTWHLRL